MHLIAQGESSPGEVLSAMLSLMSEQTTSVRMAVAYTTMGGCQLLLPQLALRAGERWDRMPKTFVTAFDFGLTEPEALEYLLGLPRSAVRVAGAELLNGSSLQPARAFHPKLYVLDRADAVGVVAGSANLTLRGLTVNTEAMVVHESAPAAEVEDVWRELTASTTVLDAALLDRYRAVRRAAPGMPMEPIVQSRPVVLNGLPAFNEAVVDGRLRPEFFNRFWIEAGSMSSGGSRTQLELPRGAHRFFGFHFATYDAAQRTLGSPVLALGGRRWDDRTLAWHGDNGMERINLPSFAQGGYDAYAGTAILFRRAGTAFELEVASWDSPLAASWRNASAQQNLIYKLGGQSPRVCGVL